MGRWEYSLAFVSFTLVTATNNVRALVSSRMASIPCGILEGMDYVKILEKGNGERFRGANDHGRGLNISLDKGPSTAIRVINTEKQ